MKNELTPDLTTGTSEYVTTLRAAHERFIRQPYALYSEENHETWRRLYTRMEPQWEKFATPVFLEGRTNLELRADAVPQLHDRALEDVCR